MRGEVQRDYRMRSGQPFVLSAAAMAVGFLSAARAELVVDFGGDYVTGTVNFPSATVSYEDINGDGTNDLVYRRELDLATPVYDDPDTNPPSGTMYGGYELVRTNTVLSYSLTHRIENNAAGDRIYLAGNCGSPIRGNVSMLILWKKGDFLNEGHRFRVYANASSTLTMTIATLSWFTVRFAILDSGNWYGSEWSITNGSGTYAVTLATHAWAPYDPASNLNFNGGGTFSTRAFDDIQAVGILIDDSTLNSNSASFSSFELDAQIEPPPQGSLILIR